MWDDTAMGKIKSLELWDHPFVKIGEHIPATHNLAFVIVEVDDPRIRDIGEVFTDEIGESDTD